MKCIEQMRLCELISRGRMAKCLTFSCMWHSTAHIGRSNLELNTWWINLLLATMDEAVFGQDSINSLKSWSRHDSNRDADSEQSEDTSTLVDVPTPPPSPLWSPPLLLSVVLVDEFVFAGPFTERKNTSCSLMNKDNSILFLKSLEKKTDTRLPHNQSHMCKMVTMTLQRSKTLSLGTNMLCDSRVRGDNHTYNTLLVCTLA